MPGEFLDAFLKRYSSFGAEVKPAREWNVRCPVINLLQSVSPGDPFGVAR